MTESGSRKGENRLNHEAITIDDCLDMYQKKGQATVIHNGHVIGFIKEGGEHSGNSGINSGRQAPDR